MSNDGDTMLTIEVEGSFRVTTDADELRLEERVTGADGKQHWLLLVEYRISHIALDYTLEQIARFIDDCRRNCGVEVRLTQSVFTVREEAQTP